MGYGDYCYGKSIKPISFIYCEFKNHTVIIIGIKN